MHTIEFHGGKFLPLSTTNAVVISSDNEKALSYLAVNEICKELLLKYFIQKSNQDLHLFPFSLYSGLVPDDIETGHMTSI